MKNSKEILKHFDSVFNTETIRNIKFDNMKLLKVLFNYFEEDIYTPSTKYSTLRHKHIEISDKLERTLTPDQRELLENKLCMKYESIIRPTLFWLE